MEIRAITVRQPWAWAIAHGGKTIENRSQGVSYRGPLAIHAGRTWSPRGGDDPRVIAAIKRTGAREVTRTTAPLGVIIAVAELVDTHPDAGCCRPWGESEYAEAGGRVRAVVYHWVLEEIRPLPDLVPCRGALGLWVPPAAVAAE